MEHALSVENMCRWEAATSVSTFSQMAEEIPYITFSRFGSLSRKPVSCSVLHL